MCSYVEKCAKFKNQTLKNRQVTKVLCTTEYSRGKKYLKIAINGSILIGLYFISCNISSEMQIWAANNI